MRNRGSVSDLNQEQQAERREHLIHHTYLCSKDIVYYVEQTYGVKYSRSGITFLLHRIGFVWKKPKLIPGNASEELRREFIAKLDKLKKEKAPEGPIYYGDGVHPMHNSIAAFGWVLHGFGKPLRINTGRRRLSINGVLNIHTQKAFFNFPESVNVDSIIRLFESLEKHHRNVKNIYVILDNTMYNRSRKIKEYLKKHPCIKIIYLPPYSPNLNLIERLWKYFKKQILYNQYYATHHEFLAACKNFFANLKKFRAPLRTLLTEKYHIIPLS